MTIRTKIISFPIIFISIKVHEKNQKSTWTDAKKNLKKINTLISY